MSENFPILIDVEEHHVGKVLRMLDVMPGVVTIHLKMSRGGSSLPLPPEKKAELLTKLTGSKRTTRQYIKSNAPNSAYNLVANALTKGAMHYTILKEILARSGLSPNNVHKPLMTLIGQKLAKRTAPGTYRLTEKGERKFKVNNETPGLPRINHRRLLPDNTRGLRSLILSQILSRGKLAHEDLKGIIVEGGYARNNLYTKVPQMMEEGLFRREGDFYELTDMGRQAIQRGSTQASSDDASSNGDRG